MPGNKLFQPNEGVSIRNPTSNQQENGNIVNPPRFAEFGGLSSGAARGIMRNGMKVQKPGNTQRNVPQRNRGAKSY